MRFIVLRKLLPIAALVLATACGSSEKEPDIFKAPIFVESGASLSYVLDARRAKVFAWDGKKRILRTLRRAGLEDRLGVPIVVGAGKKDLLFNGLALAASEDTLAVAYSLGIGEREGRLAILSLGEPPWETPPEEFSVEPSARGPFAAPEGGYWMLTPVGEMKAEWRSYPTGTTHLAPAARSLSWNAAGDRVYAASEVTDAVHILTWPELTPIADVPVSGYPLDVQVSPDDGSFAVVTGRSLAVYSADGVLEAEHPLSGLPWRVRYSRRFESRVLAVLEHSGALSFFDRDAGLCRIERGTGGFHAANFKYRDLGNDSNNRLVGLEPVGCRSQIPSDHWSVTYEGLLASGTATATTVDSLEGVDWAERGVEAGDFVLLSGFSAKVTEVAGNRLYFSPSIAAPSGSSVTYAVRAFERWVVNGRKTGFAGRAVTAQEFTGAFFKFTIAEGSAPPDPDDRFTFTTTTSDRSTAWSSPLFDLAENAQGIWLVPALRRGLVSGVDLRKSGNTWAIETVYTVR